MPRERHADGTNGRQPPQAAQGDTGFAGSDSVRPHDAIAERAHEVAADVRTDAAPINQAAEQSTDWQAHWIEPREAAEPREAREVRERAPEPSYNPEPAERPDYARAETPHAAEEPSYRPEPEPQPERKPEPPRPEHSSAPQDEPRPPSETVN